MDEPKQRVDFSTFNAGLAARIKPQGQSQSPDRSIWGDTLDLLKEGKVIPIISGIFRLEQIFQDWPVDPKATDSDGKPLYLDMDGYPLSVVEILVKFWASQVVEYPMEDKYNLTQVFQYQLVKKLNEQKGSDKEKIKKNVEEITRKEIVDFLKSSLLWLASYDPDYSDVVEGLNKHMERGELTFSEMVRQLDYPRYPEDSEDPIRILARLPLKFYITTSQIDFLERALLAEGKQPRTQICFWSKVRDSVLLEEHRTDPNFSPSVRQPMVFHLFGMENYPETLVLSEDDHMEFLISVTQDINNQHPIIPLTLKNALVESQLIFLGYRLTDWDFRVLFRLIMRQRESSIDPTRGMLIQLEDRERSLLKTKGKLEYLGRYFDLNKFDIKWKDTRAFIRELWEAWEARQIKP